MGTTWGHDPSDIPISGALALLMEALQHSAVLVQAYSAYDRTTESTLSHVRHALSPYLLKIKTNWKKNCPTGNKRMEKHYCLVQWTFKIVVDTLPFSAWMTLMTDFLTAWFKPETETTCLVTER